MRIRSQWVLAVAASAIVALVVLASLAYVTQRSTRTQQAQADSQEIARNVASLLTLTVEFTVYGGDRPTLQWRARHAQLVQTVEQALARESPPHQALVELSQTVLDLLPLFDKLEDIFHTTGSELTQRRREFMVERLVSESQELVEARYRWATAIRDEQAAEQRIFSVIVLAAPGLLLLLIVGLAWLVGRRVLLPLARLQQATTAIQRGELSARCDGEARDELGDTGRAVNAMAESLLAANGAMRAEVAQRREAEGQLRRAEQQLRRVMDSSPLGMSVCDKRGQCLYTNPVLQRIAGITAERALAGGAYTVLHPEDRERVIAGWDAAVASGAAQVSEHRYLRPDGTLVWVRRHMAPLMPDDYSDGAVTMVEDVTERRDLDLVLAARTTELARSNEELERFAYVASHDLQEPLRMVTSYGQLLVRRHQAQLNAEAREFLEFMVDGGQRAQALIADLLSLARLNSQARPMTRVALEAVLADALHELRTPIREAGATVTHDPLPTVTADARQLGQLFQNLIGNALKFRGPAAPVIHISAAQDAGAWRITVTDNGIGIEPKFFERIFVLFQRLHLRSEYEGTGIGLAICKKVVERHGGRIGVHSERGRGSTFSFTLADRLPVLEPQTADAA